MDPRSLQKMMMRELCAKQNNGSNGLNSNGINNSPKFKAPSIVVPPASKEYYEQPYYDYYNKEYLDENGNPYYCDENGNAYYIDEHGNPFYVDENGNAFAYDENGALLFYDENGNTYYPDKFDSQYENGQISPKQEKEKIPRSNTSNTIPRIPSSPSISTPPRMNSSQKISEFHNHEITTEHHTSIGGREHRGKKMNSMRQIGEALRTSKTVLPPNSQILEKTKSADFIPPHLIQLLPHTDKNTYRLQLLLNDDRVITQVCDVTDTIENIKKRLVANVLCDFEEDSVKKLQFKIPGAGFLTNEHEPVNQIPYFQNCRKRRDDPKFILVVKGSEYHKQCKRDNVTIGAFLGRPLAWQQHDDENNSFRQCMARIRLEERRKVEKERQKLNHNVPVNLGDGSIPPNRKVIVTLDKRDVSQTKKVVAEAHDTGDSFIEKSWKYFHPEKKATGEWKSYVLKVVGRSEYFVGAHKFYDFEYVQRCVATNSDIVVALKLRSEVEKPVNNTPYIFEKEEEFLSTDPVIKYDHKQLSHEYRTKSNGGDDATLLSVWDIQEDFKVKIVSADNIPVIMNGKKKKEVPANLYVEMGIYCGDEPICANKVTQIIPYAPNAKWNAFANTEVKLSDLPRETKLCFTLYAVKNTKSKKGKGGKTLPEPLGWVNCLIYNYKNELRRGKVSMKMWPEEIANPIGTVVANNTDPDDVAIVLTVEFENSYPHTVVFPTEPEDFAPYPVEPPPSPPVKEKLDQIISMHSLMDMTPEDKALMWKHRRNCMKIPKALPKYLMSVPKKDRIAIQEMHMLLTEWAEIRPVDALELLDARYADHHIRTYAVRQLDKLSNAEVEDYLLQLVQVLKYECYHDCALSRFLLKRAILNKRIGHYLYWYLKSELHQSKVEERFGLILEAFLKGGSEARDAIAAQEYVHSKLLEIGERIKKEKDSSAVGLRDLKQLNENWPKFCQLTLDPSYITKGIKIEKCRVMDSKMKPLWLMFENEDPLGENIQVMFKVGDDLRQDMLILQMFRIMDKLWKREELDLKLNPYNVIATGKITGMIEVVENSRTISKIQKAEAGSIGAFKDEVLYKWLQKENPEEHRLKECVKNFTASCAGYCVATYVLGIADRHNDNIMVKRDGHFFHIDFGHILGNFKQKFGVKRERVPFVFTPDMAYVMRAGSKKDGTDHYTEFIQWAVQAHKQLTTHFTLFINLFSMMLISGMPELQKKEDILYLVDALMDPDFENTLKATGSQVSTRINFLIHNLAHRDR